MVTSVTAPHPHTDAAPNARRSAKIPAPPEGSRPAIARAQGFERIGFGWRARTRPSTARLAVDPHASQLLPVTHMLWHGRGWSVFAVSLLALVLFPRALRAQCVDENLKEELIGGR